MRKGKTAIAIRPLIVINGGFGARCGACGTLPHRGTNPSMLPVVEAWSLNHWATREV